MEPRKRPHSDDGESSLSKKRIISSPNGSPHANGVVSEHEEPTDKDNLELFRKEAIYRRMKHYSREHERSQAQIAELERRKNTCEAGLAAIAACWTQLSDTIRLLARPEDLPPLDPETKDLFDLSSHVSVDSSPELVEALQDNMQVTQNLVSKFVQLGGQDMLRDQSYNKCQMVQTECTALRSEVLFLREKLRENKEQKEKYHTQLIAAEIRADRLQSGTVSAMHSRPTVEKLDSPAEETMESKPILPSSPSPPEPNGHIPQPSIDSEEQQAVDGLRDEKILELERERAEYREQITTLQLEVKALSPSFIAESPYYKVLLDHASRQEQIITENKDQITRLQAELDQLRSQRKEFEDSLAAASAQSLQEYKTMVAKRDGENLRLREQRDQQAAELHERKSKDSVKLASLQEFKTLAESRSERIAVLQSELNRHKAQLAANANSEDILNFLLKSSEVGVSYVEDLQARLDAAENRASAMEQSYSIFEEDHPDVIQHMRAEAEAQQRLAEATKELEGYRSIYGDLSSLDPEVQSLSEFLREKEVELQKLRLLDTQRAQAETSLYAELDKLSAAWEMLDRQVQSKVFSLSAMEERITKMGLEKAKSENKFYAAMRDKEAVETERKNIQRDLEKQTKVVDLLNETEKNLKSQVNNSELEVTRARSVVAHVKYMLNLSEKEAAESSARAEAETRRLIELRTIMQDKDKTLDKRAVELRKVEEALVRSKKEIERQAAKLKTASVIPSSSKETELESELDKCMSLLKCSTCKLQMRSTVITKCMHTFCKPCIDARISTRQRKCPACNLPFGQAEVQTIYFQ